MKLITMFRKRIIKYLGIICLSFLYTGCGIQPLTKKTENKKVPGNYGVATQSQDSATVATLNWKQFFTDSNLVALIDTALSKNQELNIILQEIRTRIQEPGVKINEHMLAG